jgi:hypothetical protein
MNDTPAATTQSDALASLKAAADAAHATFTAAAMIDPVKAKPLWVDSINVTNTYLVALQQQLAGAPADVAAAKTALDAQTQTINAQLATLQDVVKAIGFVTTLVQLVTGLAKFFA